VATTLTLALLLCSVHVRVDQDGGLSVAQVRAVVAQMRQIWSEAGVGVTSGGHDEPSGPGEATISLRILRLSVAPNSRGEPILAWTVVERDGTPAPVLLVSLPTIRAILSRAEFAGYRTDKLTIGVLDELTARAIGRAAAHELGHYILQQAGHRDSGLMRPSFSATELVGAWLRPFQVAANEWPIVRSEITALAHSQSAF